MSLLQIVPSDLTAVPMPTMLLLEQAASCAAASPTRLSHFSRGFRQHATIAHHGSKTLRVDLASYQRPLGRYLEKRKCEFRLPQLSRLLLGSSRPPIRRPDNLHEVGIRSVHSKPMPGGTTFRASTSMTRCTSRNTRRCRPHNFRGRESTTASVKSTNSCRLVEPPLHNRFPAIQILLT